ncbi:MAG TPA: hypothetical protein VII14_14425 [Xanthobacteraceae bacterium]
MMKALKAGGDILELSGIGKSRNPRIAPSPERGRPGYGRTLFWPDGRWPVDATSPITSLGWL